MFQKWPVNKSRSFLIKWKDGIEVIRNEKEKNTLVSCSSYVFDDSSGFHLFNMQ